MSSATQTIAGVERALDVLVLFAEEDTTDLGVTEIAERLGLSKAVVHRILSSFRVKGFVEIDEATHRYRVGARALTVGLSYLDRVDRLDVAREAMLELAERTQETATQSVAAGRRSVYVGQVPSPRQVRVVVKLGMDSPLHRGAASRVLLAHLDPVTLEQYLVGELEPSGNGDAPSPVGPLREQLEVIRQEAYALSWGERETGVGAAASPVFDHTGRCIGALAVCGPVDRFRTEIDDHVKTLIDVSEQASRALGWATASVPA